ncbi:hypothetical protein UlMin_026408 [Ulmus minor]
MLSPKRAKLSSHSAQTIANNDDLLIEILLRLPIKSLLKFKSVSKHFLSLITHPRFSGRHSSHPSTASALFFKRCVSVRTTEFNFINFNNRSSNSSPAPSRSFSFADERSCITILQSCNGLLLCSTSHRVESRRNYYVYNPTTKHYSILPRLPVPRTSTSSRTVYRMSLAFDPSKSPNYKVVCVRNCDSITGQFQIEIYSSDTGPWRLSGGSFPGDFDVRLDDGVYWNGSVHWLSSWGTSLYFNVDEERLSEMPVPPLRIPENYYDEIDKKFRYFGESRNHLHLIDNYEEETTCFDVYEMERDYSGWFVKFRVDLSEFLKAFPEIIPISQGPVNLQNCQFSILCVVRVELDDESFMVLKIFGKVLRYDFRTKAFYKLCDIEQDRSDNHYPSEWCGAYQFIESIACV